MNYGAAFDGTIGPKVRVRSVLLLVSFKFLSPSIFCNDTLNIRTDGNSRVKIVLHRVQSEYMLVCKKNFSLNIQRRAQL